MQQRFGCGSGDERGTSDDELTHSLRGVSNFVGVFSADQLPTSFPVTDACLIVNYSDQNDPSGGTHWVAILHLNNKQEQPAFFDSYGFAPDDENSVLHTDANFHDYLKNQSKKAGHGGKFTYNLVNMQSSDGDECGEFSAYCCKVNVLPFTDKCMNAPWKRVLNMSAAPEAAQRNIKRIMGIR